MAAGLVEDHAAEAVGEHHRHLAGLHVVGIEHGAGAAAHLLGRGLHVPLGQVFGPAGAAVAATGAGAVLAIGGQHGEAQGLVQADVPGKGAVTGSHQHLLPVAGVATAAGLQVGALTFELVGALQQPGGGLGQGWTGPEPGGLAGAEIPQGRQAVEPGRCGVSQARSGQTEHAQGLLEGAAQAGLTQVVGGHKPIALAPKDADAGPGAKGGTDAGDALLFGQHPQVVGAFEEHLDQVGAGGATQAQQALQGRSPGLVEAVGQSEGAGAGGGQGDDQRMGSGGKGPGGELVDRGLAAQRTAGWNCSLRIGAMKNNFAISAPLASQRGSLRSSRTGAGAPLASAALRASLF